MIRNISTHCSIKSTLIIPPGHSADHLLEGINSINLALKKTEYTPEPASVASPVTGKKEQGCIHLNGFMLGSFNVLINGLRVYDWQGRKAKSILAYLLYNRRFANTREIIMDKFWPNVSAQSARNSLNAIIHKIRRVLKCLDPHNDYILFKDDRYLLNPKLSISLDYESFLTDFNTGQQLERERGIAEAIPYYEEATRLYKGDFLEENIYDEWTYSERESFKQKYLHAMDRLSAFYVKQEKYLLAQQYCRKMLEKDDCLEEVHRRLMICLYQNGYRDLAVKQFYNCGRQSGKRLGHHAGSMYSKLTPKNKSRYVISYSTQDSHSQPRSPQPG